MNSINERVNGFLPLDEPGTQEFLAMFAENQSDEGLGNFIRDYESQSRIFSVPVLEAFDINQRKDDLFFGGIPFTSEKRPWPLDSKGCRLYPIAQIDLKNASEIIQTLIKMKPSAAKGTYIKSIYLSATMSPGILIDSKSVNA
jgi:hypothetical protein